MQATWKEKYMENIQVAFQLTRVFRRDVTRFMSFTLAYNLWH